MYVAIVRSGNELIAKTYIPNPNPKLYSRRQSGEANVPHGRFPQQIVLLEEDDKDHNVQENSQSEAQMKKAQPAIAHFHKFRRRVRENIVKIDHGDN